MQRLSLRLRVFLFFCLMALGGLAVVLGALWMGYRQLGDPTALSSFVTSAVAAGLGITGIVVAVWLLFDENVSKPIERVAAQLRVRASSDAAGEIETANARYLGDLAPAASAVQQRLVSANSASAAAVETQTARLQRQCAQLLRILSDVPIAVILARTDHQIVLYDGQAAELMEREAPIRLDASVFDYLDDTAIINALADLQANDMRRQEIAVRGRSGALYSGHIRRFRSGEGYTLMLEPLGPDAARPLVYDFDLLDKSKHTDLDATALRDLTFVVFDSETTGLNPDKDRVVQLGAVRVVNGKVVPGETFDTLVDPGMPIPPGSTKVHHIDDAMVQGAPAFAQACADFHRFARDAVIVAHNAPFDMAFLHREQAASGVAFDHPVLDTVHLSAVVFGGSEVHTLDALCDRLRITIPAEQRHTAMGDAVATAAVLCALMPILEARGLNTFGQIRAEVQKHTRLLKTAD
jgi:DNA polymerase-3 subunit epsilon